VEWGDAGRLAGPFEDSVKKAAEKKSEMGS